MSGALLADLSATFKKLLYVGSIMEVIALETIGLRIYKAQKLSDGLVDLKSKDLLEKPKKFMLAAKSCDGTYHSVNSDIAELLKKKKELIKKGIIGEIVSALIPDETIHGQRFIVFNPTSKTAYLLGDVVTAMKKLAS